MTKYANPQSPHLSSEDNVKQNPTSLNIDQQDVKVSSGDDQIHEIVTMVGKQRAKRQYDAILSLLARKETAARIDELEQVLNTDYDVPLRTLLVAVNNRIRELTTTNSPD